MLGASGRASAVQLLGRPFGLLNLRNVISPNFIAEGRGESYSLALSWVKYWVASPIVHTFTT
jgi:hypothetical protein